MNSTKKAEALAQWRQSLNGRGGWANPCAQYRYLLRYADKLLATGAIDQMERFDMVELALAAFCHFIEEVPQEWRHPASEYDVYNMAGEQVGSLSGSRYFLHGKSAKPEPMSFFAQVHDRNGEQILITRTLSPYGVLRDRYIYTETGQRLVLVESSRRFDDEMRQRLDDPDVYRAIVDASIVALEQGDMTAYVDLWEKENFSIFTQCSQCCDRFYLREDCSACGGRGFVEDPLCPSKLPYPSTQ
jgi:hypothetical protein